jgi:hypothetical protein
VTAGPSVKGLVSIHAPPNSVGYISGIGIEASMFGRSWTMNNCFRTTVIRMAPLVEQGVALHPTVMRHAPADNALSRHTNTHSLPVPRQFMNCDQLLPPPSLAFLQRTSEHSTQSAPVYTNYTSRPGLRPACPYCPIIGSLSSLELFENCGSSSSLSQDRNSKFS